MGSEAAAAAPSGTLEVPMSEGWVQFLLVAVPVLSLVGSWLALRVVAGRKARRKDDESRDG